MASRVLLGKVAGTIKKKNWKAFMSDHRKPMLKQVGQAVDTWIDGGYVGVDYPRRLVRLGVRLVHEAGEARRERGNAR